MMVLTPKNVMFRFRISLLQTLFKIGVFKKFRKLHRETPVLESLFNKVAGLMPKCDFNNKVAK